jgi:hypothetical protein
MKIETIKITNYNERVPFTIEADTYDECLTKFFKLNNQLTYCNGYSYSLIEEKDKQAYSKWFSIENYAKNGGDMW